MHIFRAVAVSAGLLGAFAAAQTALPAEVAGRWEARTPIAAGDVEFQLDVRRDGARLRAELVNGSDRIQFSSAAFDGKTLTLRLDEYDSTLTAGFAAGQLRGEYVRQTSKGVRRYPVTATRANITALQTAPTQPDLAGDWTVQFRSAAGVHDKVAPASLRAAGMRDGRVRVEGTVAPVSGDYGLLAGWYDPQARAFKLSRFDGIHLVVFKGELLRDGTLAGELGFGPTRVDKFTASRRQQAEAALPDAENVTRVQDPNEPFRFSGRDPRTGRLVTQDDPRFRGKVVIVDIYGTWCPNCHDEAPVLVELWKKYHREGLEIVGLGYEYTDDFQRSSRQVAIYRNKFGIPFPLLISGTTDEGQIEKTLPQLIGFGAYPTTIFIGRDGRVKTIHAGFTGPSTPYYKQARTRFEQIVQELLRQP